MGRYPRVALRRQRYRTAQSMVGALEVTLGAQLAFQAHDDRVQRQAEDADVTACRGEPVFADSGGFQARPPVECAVEFGGDDTGDDDPPRAVNCGSSECGTPAASRIAVSATKNGSSGWMKSAWWLNE